MYASMYADHGISGRSGKYMKNAQLSRAPEFCESA